MLTYFTLHGDIYTYSAVRSRGSWIFHMVMRIVDFMALLFFDSGILFEKHVTKETEHNCAQSRAVNWNGVEILFSDIFPWLLFGLFGGEKGFGFVWRL